jgi:hypothetical protein
MTYPDGTYMGKNRLYRAEDIMNSAEKWWKYAIIVSPQSQFRKETGKRESAFSNMDDIPNQKGGSSLTSCSIAD